MQSNLRLVTPAPEHEDAVWRYRGEYLQSGAKHIHGSGSVQDSESYGQWLEKLERDISPAPESGRVPQRTYLAFEGGALVGMISVRHTLNDFLLSYGGHIGYGVHPSARGRGCATRMLALALEKCRELGLARVLVTCDKSNPASARVIQKNGGALEDERAQPDGEVVQRYWITL